MATTKIQVGNLNDEIYCSANFGIKFLPYWNLLYDIVMALKYNNFFSGFSTFSACSEQAVRILIVISFHLVEFGPN